MTALNSPWRVGNQLAAAFSNIGSGALPPIAVGAGRMLTNPPLYSVVTGTMVMEANDETER